jgi:hypothetical protein
MTNEATRISTKEVVNWGFQSSMVIWGEVMEQKHLELLRFVVAASPLHLFCAFAGVLGYEKTHFRQNEMEVVNQEDLNFSNERNEKIK